MFPNVAHNVTLCNQHDDRLAWIGLQERVLSWLRGIHDPEPQSPASSSFIGRVSKDRKRRHYSPYPMRCEPPRAPSPPIFSHMTQPQVTTLESDFPASASEMISPIWRVEENVAFHTTSLIEFKVTDDLPDPEYNPLITFFATDIEEEYCRLLFLCNKLEADKIDAEVRWKCDLSHAAMRDLLDIKMSIQRVLQSAQYVIDYAYCCNINVDFQTLFLQHYHHPLQPSTEKSIFHGISYCDESATPNPSLYPQGIQDQELSGFDYQAFTSLDPNAHNIWLFE